MDVRNFLATRRDGGRHTESEIDAFVAHTADGSIPDYQLAAWLMAAYIHPLDADETAWLTAAMARHGEQIDLAGLPKPWVDKHSTGGVGDKTTLVLLPILAACGLTMVKVSGRGLGITGGTLDKLSSVPGFRIDLTPDEMRRQAEKIGLALTGQTPNLAPADKRLYALRDVTETTSSIPLLVSSILCKKIAGGAETIVLDVKSGSGGFMRDDAGAARLAHALSETAQRLGLNCHIALTDMEQPLGAMVGNALEVEEARQILNDVPLSPPSQRFQDLCVTLAGLTLAAAGTAIDPADGERQALEALTSGRARAKAEAWFAAQGGDFEAALPHAPVTLTYAAPSDGWWSAFDARTVGVAVIDLGGGRHKKEDVIDPRVGVELHEVVGTHVTSGTPLFTVHAADEGSAQRALDTLSAATFLTHTAPTPRPLIRAVLSPNS